jgi:hypothetical protein
MERDLLLKAQGKVSIADLYEFGTENVRSVM